MSTTVIGDLRDPDVDRERIAAYHREAGTNRAIRSISAQLEWLHKQSCHSLFVDLWMEDGVPQLRLHVRHSDSFENVRTCLVLMRDRLTQEIANGPAKCPYAPAGEPLSCECGHPFESHCNAACVQGCYDCECRVYKSRKLRVDRERYDD